MRADSESHAKLKIRTTYFFFLALISTQKLNVLNIRISILVAHARREVWAGIELNEKTVRKHLAEGEKYFE